MPESPQERLRWVVGICVGLIAVVGGASWTIALQISDVEESADDKITRVTHLIEQNAAAITLMQLSIKTNKNQVRAHESTPYHPQTLGLVDSEVDKALRPVERTLQRIEGKVDAIQSQ